MRNTINSIFLILFMVSAHAETLPPGMVKSKTLDGAGTPITSTLITGKQGLDVNVISSSGGTSTVDQGNAGSQAWLFDLSKLFGAAPSVSNYMPARITNGTTYVDPTQIRALNSGTDSVTITGSITATNSANGATGSPVPAQATQVAGKDGSGNLRALSVSSSGVLSVDGSSVTQPVSGSVSVSNLPSVQAVSQSSPPWSFNLTQLGGSSFSPTNYLPSRITNGTSYVDPTQIRALTSGTDSVNVGNFPATQSVTGTVTANAGTGTFTVGQSSGANLHANIDASALPTGAATSALQTTGNSSLASIDTKLPSGLTVSATRLLVDGSGVTQPISVSSLPLPTGAATSALQTSGNASLTSIDSKTPALGQALAAGSVPVVLTAAQLATLTPLSTVSVTQNTSPWVVSGTVTANAGTNLNTSALALESGGNLASINTKIPANLTVSSTRLLVDGSGVTQPVSLASVPLPTGAATSANQTNASQKTQLVDGAGAVVGPVTTISSVNYLPVVLAASATPGAALVARSIQIAGSDGTNAQTIQTDSTGKVIVGPKDTTPATQAITTQDTGSTTTAQANGQNAITGTPTAGSAASFALTNYAGVEVQVTGTWTGTLQTEVSMDGGTTWYTRGIKQTGSPYLSSSFTANFEGGMNFAGMTNVRVRSVAALPGSATVRIVGTNNDASLVISNPLTLRDATTQTISDTIKAASTAALTTDTALVVALSPNSPAPASTGHTSVQLVRNNYATTNVTTGAYVQLIASTSDTTNQLYIFDSSGQTLVLAVGAAASEVDKAYIVPGGNGELNLTIPSGSRVSVKAVSASATAGELSITFLK